MANIIKQLKDADGNNIYPLAYAMGGVKMDLLWTNPNPTSEFTAQTLQLNLSNYDYLLIMFCATTNSTAAKVFSIVQKTSTYKQRITTCSDFIYFRDITSITDTGIDFTTGNRTGTYGTTTSSSTHAIPIQIYGLKTSWVVPTSVQGLQYVEV